MEDCAECIQVLPIINGYKLLFKALTLIPVSHYVLGLLCVSLVLVYNFLEFHFIEDFLSGGSVVKLTYASGSELYQNVVSKCKILHGRYFATPWLASPHFQTILLEFVGKPPLFTYKRELFQSSDGGTFALDWLLSSDVLGSCDTKSNDNNAISNKDTTTPIVVVVPGLTSDSSAAYIRFYAFNTAKLGWNVVICNHRGMGGVPFTSDHFYNAGKTNDIRDVINHLRDEYPEAPLFLVGISIGANIVGKYLGEDGKSCPVDGAAVVCSPWDLLIGCRFIARKFVQRIYDRILAISLQAYGHLNQAQYTKLADWEGLLKARSIREWNRSATCVVDKIATVDTYYRWASCASYVSGIAVPLLCISSMDDPVCPAEAIPWDECRLNKNVVLVTTKHGGHMGYLEGLTASGLWWVRAVNEYLDVLHSSTLMHKQKKSQIQGHCSMPETCFDQSSYVVSVSNGMVAAVDVVEEKPSRLTTTQNGKAHAIASDAEHNLEN